VYPIGVQSSASSGGVAPNVQPLGIIKFKMRLRKPIQETMRYFREKSEIQNITRNLSVNPKHGSTSVRSLRKLITINVVGCQNLKVRYSELSNVAPFFYYQFYTFDEIYSPNGEGTSPHFDESKSYDVLLDSKAISYFERESLEIILFDDNAPIAGQGVDEPVAGQGDDMIGMARVPLKSLVEGCSIHDKFNVRGAGSVENIGTVEVRISIMDLDRVDEGEQIHKAVQNLQYNQ